MRVTVIGAGIVGVCTAWSLAEAGCEVTVVERNRGVAQETSYGNAGLVAPPYEAPSAAPGMPARILSTLFAADAPVRLRPTLDPALWRWAARWLGECRIARYRQNRERMQRVATYGRVVLSELRSRHDIAYERTEGLLQLLRSEQDVSLSAPATDFLKGAGVAHRMLTPAECRAREPGISDIAFAGGVFLPDAETGNCPLFARQLKGLCEERGVRFRFGTVVERIDADDHGVRLAMSAMVPQDDGTTADAVVIAAGAASLPLLRQVDAPLPLHPVKSYAASIAIREPTFAPVAAIVDDAYRVAIVRMGNRIRVAGTAELGDRALSLRSRHAERAFATLLKVARDWFPGAAQYQGASWWVGAGGALPDGAPVVGAAPRPRVFVNVGHGSNGWAMAPGAGRVIADLVTGRTPEIDLDGLTPARYR